MAAGEAACASVHGANRLGANSLLDIVVFGRAAALTTSEIMKPNETQPELPKDAGLSSLERLDRIRFSQGKYRTSDIRLAMQKTMQRNAAVFRIEKTLKEGCQKMGEIYQMFPEIGITDRGLVWNTDLVEALELENLLCNYFVTFHHKIYNRKLNYFLIFFL